MIGIERHPLPPSGRHFPWWIFHCSDPSWKNRWGHNFQSLVYDFHRPQKLACVCQFRHVGFYSPVVYDTIDTQSFQVLDGGQVVLIICPGKDDLKMRHSWPLLVVPIIFFTPDRFPWLRTIGWGLLEALQPWLRVLRIDYHCQWKVVARLNTEEASHLGEPDAVCDGPGSRVPVVLVLWVPPLGEQQHREAVLFAGEPETNLACKRS